MSTARSKQVRSACAAYRVPSRALTRVVAWCAEADTARAEANEYKEKLNLILNNPTNAAGGDRASGQQREAPSPSRARA